MANEVKRIVDPPKASKRQQDIETLASAIFVKMYLAERGVKLPTASAKDAVTAAREFYKVVDTIEV